MSCGESYEYSRPMQTSSRKIGILAVLGSALCFGTTGTTQQLGVPEISPLAVGAARLLCGSLFLFLFAYVQRGSRGSFRAPSRDLFICGLGVAIYQLTFFSAVHITGIAISTVTALGSVPTFSAIVAYFVLGEKPQRSWYLGTSVTVLGIILVGTANGVDSFKPFGILLAAIAGLGFAVFNVISRRSLARGAQDIWLTATSFGIAALFTAPFLFAQNPEWILTRDGGLSVLWLGLVPTAIGYFLFTFGLKRVDSSTAATVVLAEPATATLLAALIIGESLVFQSFLGIAIVAAGILYISNLKN
jgi:DME family drug/metabolite transporter